MPKKPKATRNKAKVVETLGVSQNQLQSLWVEFGKLSAQQEIQSIQLQQIAKRKQQVYSRIMELEKKKAAAGAKSPVVEKKNP